MALKVLMLRKKIDEKRKALETLNERSAELETREAELAEAIEEATDGTEEEKQAVEEEVEKFEEEKAKHEEEKAELDSEVRKLEEELHALEEEQERTVEEPAKVEEREDNKPMSTRDKFGVANYIEREEVKAFIDETRNAIKEKRAISNVGLTIPEVFLGLLKENIEGYSKLAKYVRIKKVNGTGRQTIMGGLPEGIWLDCCGTLNELDLGFYEEEFDCWKVGGFYAICNANLEDSDVDLANEILDALSRAIGFALDKAILYGTGTRMPLGIVTRLAQTSAPADYPATARPWVDLHTSNIKSIAASTTGADLIAEIVRGSGAAKGKYSRGTRVFVMNETTLTNLKADMININAAGAVVSGINNTMPVIGGNIEELEFIPDDVIITGFFDLYTLVERAGKKFAQSEHVRFIQDQTLFKGTARYDGQPTISEGFVAIGINGVTPDANVPFAPDEANTEETPEDPDGV